MKKEGDFSEVSYVLGIVSIVFSVLIQPTFGLGFGITGLILSSRNKSELSKKAKKLSIIGIVISVIILIILAYLVTNQVLENLSGALI